MLQVRTRNGLFANEGYGGGVFNYNTAFGSVDTPQAIGGLVQMPRRSVGSLPTMTVIPEHCWDSPGFVKEEKFIRSGEAKLKCDYCASPEGQADDFTCGGYTTHWDCMERVVNDYLWNWSGAVNKFCPKDMSHVPRALTAGEACDSDIAIRNVQYKVGTDPDGDWGPLSQEAYDIAREQNGNTWCDYVPGCAGASPFGEVCGQIQLDQQPVPVPIPTPVPQPTEPEPVTPAPVEETKKGSGTVLLLGLGMLGLAGVIAVMGSKNKR